MTSLSRRAYGEVTSAYSWEEIWEAGPYYDRIADLLEDAQSYAILVGWQIDSRLPLRRPLRGGGTLEAFSNETLREKVIRLCEEKAGFQVFFLFWDHALFYVTERELWQGRIWENIHPRVHFVFDNRHPVGGSHHEKISIIDGKTALCGGIDLCDERWDSPVHSYSDSRRSLDRRRENHGPYHDLAVQVTGPICRGIQEHVVRRWRSLSTIPIPEPARFSVVAERSAASIGHKVYISRTLVKMDDPQVTLVREVEFLFRDLIESAQKRIILEGQYYWSKVLNDMILGKIRKMKGRDFEIILILAELRNIKSLTRHMMTFELDLLRPLHLAAEQAGVRLFVGAPYSVSPFPFFPPKPVYIHSKIIIIDDSLLSIGSANFATRALRIDTEMQLTLEASNEMEKRHIQRVAREVLTHWNFEDSVKGRTIRMRSLGKPGRDRSKQSFSGFFDPSVPWFYYFKKKALKMKRLKYPVWILSWIFYWLFWWVLFLKVAGLESEGTGAVLLSLILSSVWLVPIPFMALVALAVFDLGPQAVAKAAVTALWTASALGYSLGRVFPGIAGRLYREKFSSKRFSSRLGLRNFAEIMNLLFDPTVSLRSKIAFQGLYYIPVSWFVLGTGIILPAMIYFFSGKVIPFFLLWLPETEWAHLRKVSLYLFLGIFGFCAGRVLSNLWRNVD